MKNYIQSGERLKLIAPAGGVVAGQGYIIGSLFVIAETSAIATAEFIGLTQGVFELTKLTHATTEAFVEGQRLFWDNTNKRFTKTSATGLYAAGAAVLAAASTDATALVRLDGVSVVAVP